MLGGGREVAYNGEKLEVKRGREEWRCVFGFW